MGPDGLVTSLTFFGVIFSFKCPNAQFLTQTNRLNALKQKEWKYEKASKKNLFA